MKYSREDIENEPEKLTGLIAYHGTCSHTPLEYREDEANWLIDLHRDLYSEMPLKRFQELILVGSGLSKKTIQKLLEWTSE